MYSLGAARVTSAPTTRAEHHEAEDDPPVAGSVANQEPTSMVVASSVLMRSSGVRSRHILPQRHASPRAAAVMAAERHALEDREVVVRECAAVEVLEHVAAAVAPEPARPPRGRRRGVSTAAASSASLPGSKARPQSASVSSARASPSKPSEDGLLHGRVLEELGRQDGGEERLLAEVHEAGVAARQVAGQLGARHQAGEHDVVEALGAGACLRARRARRRRRRAGRRCRRGPAP